MRQVILDFALFYVLLTALVPVTSAAILDNLFKGNKKNKDGGKKGKGGGDTVIFDAPSRVLYNPTTTVVREATCSIVQDDVWEEKCKTEFDEVCSRISKRKCNPVTERECSTQFHNVCSVVWKPKCHNIDIPKCKLTWEKECNFGEECNTVNERVCTNTPKQVCRTIENPVCHTVNLRECKEVRIVETETVVNHHVETPVAATSFTRVPVTTTQFHSTPVSSGGVVFQDSGIPTKTFVSSSGGSVGGSTVFVDSGSGATSTHLHTSPSSITSSSSDVFFDGASATIASNSDILQTGEIVFENELLNARKKRSKDEEKKVRKRRGAELFRKLGEKKFEIEAKLNEVKDKLFKGDKKNKDKKGGNDVVENVRTEVKCHDVPKEQCTTVKSQDCRTEPHQTCRTVPRQECRTVEKCKNKPRKTCEIETKEKCLNLPSRECRQQPKEVCENVQRQHCRNVDSDVCHSKPRKVCKKIIVQRPREVCVPPPTERQILASSDVHLPA